MVKKKLVDELINDGAKLLWELDRRNFPVECMFWIHMAEADYWRLIISSPVVTEQGGASAYLRLGELLRGIQLAGVNLEDISLFDPSSPEYRSILGQARSSSRLASGPAWIEFEDAVFYRWTSASVSGDLSCDVKDEELRKFWESERTRSNLPALLINQQSRRITLRFHPQHGTLGGIEEIKRSFTIALHRPDARPDCSIKWLNQDSRS